MLGVGRVKTPTAIQSRWRYLTGKKKKILTIAIIASLVFVLVLVGGYFLVDKMFSKVTETVGETMSGEMVDLPVLDDNKQIINGENISVVLDEKTIKELEAKIPISEKLEILSLLAQSLDPKDYSTLLSYAASGVNNEKFNKAYQLMRESLDPEEKEKIKSYYVKYIHLLSE